jgi:hypothetical protein
MFSCRHSLRTIWVKFNLIELHFDLLHSLMLFLVFDIGKLLRASGTSELDSLRVKFLQNNVGTNLPPAINLARH